MAGAQNQTKTELEKWFETFESASPKQRYNLLLDQLQAPATDLTADILEYAVASVNQMLVRHNLLEDLTQLHSLLQHQQPALAARMLPVINMVALDQALYDSRSEALPALLEAFVAYPDELPEDLWMTILDRLSFYGYTALAVGLAQQLQQKFGPERLSDDSLLNSRLREQILLGAIEAYWQSAQDETAKQAFDNVITGLQEEDAELLEIMYQQRDADIQTQLAVLLEKFHRRATFSSVHNGQMAFGRWALQTHGLNLYTSAEIMSHVVMLWRMNPDRDDAALSLEQLVQITDDQVDEYFTALDEDADMGLDGMMVFCWGLPLVLDWLQALGLRSAADNSHLRTTLSEMKEALNEEAGQALWVYAFVTRWPRAGGQSDQEAASECEAFAASRTMALPLSDDPADSALFDEDAIDISEEELMAFMSEQLAGLNPQEREQVISMMAAEFGQEASDELVSLLQQPASGLILPASYRPDKA